LTPRGHTERIEHQLAQCEALLKRHIPGFDLNNLDDILAREGIDITVVNPQQATPAFQFAQPTTSRPFRPDGGLAAPLPGAQGPKYPYPPPQHMVPPGYPHPIPLYGAPPPGSPYPHPPPPMMQMPGPPTPYNPHIHPAFQQHPPPQIHTQPQSQQPQSQPAQQSIPNDIKGQDPQSNDMSNTQVRTPFIPARTRTHPPSPNSRWPRTLASPPLSSTISNLAQAPLTRKTSQSAQAD